jgi:hypothetical protein
MTRPHAAAALALAVSSLFFADAGLACSTTRTGAACIQILDAPSTSVPSRPERIEQVAASSSSAATPAVDVGAILPRGEYSLILNADYFGLPAVSDGWVYMRVGNDAYRVDWQTHEVLERVTENVAANF